MSDGPPGGLFRKEAIDAHLSVRGEGELLRLTPSWTQWTFWVLLAVFLSSIAYSLIGTIDEYASGLAVVRVEGRSDLTARVAGTVASVEVQPGQRVSAGQILVRFHGDEADLAQLEQEFEGELIKMLANPTDEAARASLTSLRARRDGARARKEERLIKAPKSGIVSDIRIRPGQLLQPGESVITLVPDDAKFSVIAILPGAYRPRLAPGMKLRVEMAGYHYAYREIIIDRIGDEVVGPAEIRNYLGKELADTINVAGPVVLVEARLPERTFVAQDRTYSYFDGMQGRAEARVGSESVLVTFIPGLKAIF